MNQELKSFIEYCESHPQERFWQSLKNWSEYGFILGAYGLDLETGEYKEIEDTFYKFKENDSDLDSI